MRSKLYCCFKSGPFNCLKSVGIIYRTKLKLKIVSLSKLIHICGQQVLRTFEYFIHSSRKYYPKPIGKQYFIRKFKHDRFAKLIETQFADKLLKIESLLLPSFVSHCTNLMLGEKYHFGLGFSFCKKLNFKRF